MATATNLNYPVTPNFVTVQMLANGSIVSAPASVASAGTVTSSSATAGIGYTTGAGGAVTQLTSRATGVTLNKIVGEVTMFSAAGSVTAASFTVTNSAIAATDNVILNQKSGTNKYVLMVTAKAAGSFEVTFFTTGGVATDAPVIGFEILKGVTA